MEVVLGKIWLPLMVLVAVSALSWLALYWTRGSDLPDEVDARKTTRVPVPGMANIAPIDAYAPIEPDIVEHPTQAWQPDPAPPVRRGNPPPFPPPARSPEVMAPPPRGSEVMLPPPRLAGEMPVDPNAPTPPSRWTPALPPARRFDEPPPRLEPPPPLPPTHIPQQGPRREIAPPPKIDSRKPIEPPVVATVKPEAGPPNIPTRKAEAPPVIATRKQVPGPPPFIKSRRNEAPPAPTGWVPEAEDAPTTEKMMPWAPSPKEPPPPPQVSPYDPNTMRRPPPVIDTRRRGMVTNRIGANLVINVPAQQQSGLILLPPRLEVIYGNFSPTDPREILLYELENRPEETRFIISSSQGEGVHHLQLNHFTVYPEVHAEMVKMGQHDFVLHNRVPHGQEERFQTRVNGAVLKEGENRRLQSGDILSLGIYRLRYSL